MRGNINRLNRSALPVLHGYLASTPRMETPMTEIDAIDMTLRELGSDTNRSVWSNNAMEILKEAYRAARSKGGERG